MALVQEAMAGFTPEKEQMASKGFKIGKNLIYQKQVFDAVIQKTQEASPAGALSEAIVFVLEKIQEKMKMPFDVLLAVGLALLADLVDALNQTGRFQLGEADISKAVEIAVAQYLQVHGKEFDQKELMAQYEQGVQQMGGQQQPPGGM